MLNDSTPAAKIASQEAKIARLRHELEIAEAVLSGMNAVVMTVVEPSDQMSITGRVGSYVSDNPVRGASTKASTGRQPGAISHQWRDTLALLWKNYPFPQGFTEYNAATAAQAAGLPNVGPKIALNRMTAYLSHGYVERLPDGKWRVTNFTAEKYGFGRNKDEAPSALALEPHESLPPGDQTGAD
jgi:hypothetical protein